MTGSIDRLKAYSKYEISSLNIATIQENLNNESDRGLIVVATTMIDDSLKEVLSSRFSNLTKKELKDLFGFSGSLGSFSAKINMAYALGIFTKEERNISDLARNLRNSCAHCMKEISFKDQIVLDVMKSIFEKGNPQKLNDTSRKQRRDLYVMLCGALSGILTDNNKPRARKSLSDLLSFNFQSIQDEIDKSRT